MLGEGVDLQTLDLGSLAGKALASEALTREEALMVLRVPDVRLLSLVQAAYDVRRAHFGNRVKLNVLLNVQSGLCPEDCHYCSQSKVSDAPIARYPLLPREEFLSAAERAVELRAKRLCLVASGRGPSDREVRTISGYVQEVRSRFPGLEICTCLGLLRDDQARELKQAGVFAYNHNLNTSERFYGQICSTHTYHDRVATVETVKCAGLSPCCGMLLGMGESDEDIAEGAFALREIGVDSLPVNFLIPVPGTPLQGKSQLTPQRCIRILCLFRFLHPATEIRIAGGREVHLRSLQALGLYIANSVFIGVYHTTHGQTPDEDYRLLADGGWEIEGYARLEPVEPVASTMTRKEEYLPRA
jgi:biotin synthase